MKAEIFYRFGPTTAGYRMETYRRLPVGWSPAPPELPTDLFMWRKFLALPGIAAGTRFVVTSLHFPTPQRRDWPIERRREEMARYSGMIASQAGRDGIREQAFRGAAREHMARYAHMVELINAVREQQTELARVRASWSWRLTAPLRGVARLVRGKGLGSFVRLRKIVPAVGHRERTVRLGRQLDPVSLVFGRHPCRDWR